MNEEGAKKAAEELARLRASRETRTEPHEWELELPELDDEEDETVVVVLEKKEDD